MASSGGPSECSPDYDASCVRANPSSLLPPTQHLMPPFDLELGPAYLTVLAVTSAIYLIMVFGIRLFLRLKVNGPFGKDDWACATSTVFGLVYSILVIVQVFFGLGSRFRKLPQAEAETIAIIGWANAICLTFAGYFSKVSACYLLARITKTKKHLVVAYVLLGAMTLWVIQAQFYTIFQCKYPRPWDTSPNNTCHDRWGHRLSTAITSWILELVLLAAAIHLVWSIQMPFKTKAKVVVAFGLRLLLIAPSACRLKPLHASVFTTDPAAEAIRLQVMSLLTCQVSVISATIPCAKPFFSVFSRGLSGKPRCSILPLSRPTTSRPVSATPTVQQVGSATTAVPQARTSLVQKVSDSIVQRARINRHSSVSKLHLRPLRGITFANA